MSKAKKVIFVIVEGPTDEDALSSVLKQIFSSAEVHFHVIHGDITTEDAITANNAKSYVAKRIAAEMKKYAYKESDILQIVHLIDKKSGIQKDFHTITCMMHCYRYKIGIFAIAGVLLSDIKSILVEVWNTQEHLQEHGEKIYVIAQDDNGKLCAKSMANIIHSV